MRTVAGWALAACLAGVAVASCTTTCEIPECAEPLRVTLVSRCWPDGAYRVSGTMDGEPFEVAVALPVTASRTASGDGLVVVEASNALGLEAVAFQGTPSSLTLEIRHGDTLVGTDTESSIFYEEHRYGGDGCDEGSCPSAHMAWYADDAAIATLCAVPGA
jgi:hypothetical protein